MLIYNDATLAQIDEYLNSIPEPKRTEMQQLHQLIININLGCELWYFDGKDNHGKVISNRAIGYGSYTIHYANGTSKPYFQIGLLANTKGISIHILGKNDKTYLIQNFAGKLGKAKLTGYCISFKTIKDIDMNVLEDIITYGFEAIK